MKTALLLLALAGCESGIVIEVRAPAGTQEVALFLATAECASCAPIQPPFSDYRFDGTFYERDGASLTAPVDRTGSAWFRFEPSESESAFDVVLAVGMGPVLENEGFRTVSGSTVLHDVDAAGPRQLVIELAPEADDGPHARVWEAAGTDDVCAAYVQGAPSDALVIVPATNPDCDSVAGAEDCDQLSHETNVVTPELEEATCLTSQVVPALDPMVEVCMVGGRTACSQNMCEPTNYCAPDNACFPCARDSKLECVGALRQGLRIICDFPVEPSVGGPGFDACERGLTPFPLELPQCTSLDLALVEQGAPIRFTDKVSLNTGIGGELSVLAKVPDPSAVGCTAEIEIKGSYVATALNILEEPIVARIQVDGLPVEGAVVPLLLKPVRVPDGGSCETSDIVVSCRLEKENDLAAICLEAPPP